MATVELDGVGKSFGEASVVRDVSLRIADREFVVLVGPSGCGKSTILRMIAGLEEIGEGEVRIDGRRVNEVQAKDRNLAMVFQDYALYPNMTVAENIGFGLRMQGIRRATREARVREVAAMLQLEGLLDRKPRALSGGQRQRVAMGRSLARDARAFLFDEPLSNLDAKLRLDVRTQIRLLHRDLGMTSIFVTHDQTEAMTLADRIVCLENGRVAQVGTPQDLYASPASVFVAGFIGAPPINLFRAAVERGVSGPQARLACDQIIALAADAPVRPGQAVTLGLRPEHLTDISPGPGEVAADPLRAEALLVESLGADTFLIAQAGGQRLTARCRPGFAAEPGAPVTLQAAGHRAHLFDPASGRRLQ